MLNTISMRSLAVGTMILAGTFLSSCTKKVMIGADEVRYQGTATKEEAEALGNALKEGKYFTGRGVTVVLSKGGDGTVISFVVKDGSWDDPANVEIFAGIGRAMAPTVGGFPIKVRMVNQTIETKKEIPITADTKPDTKSDVPKIMVGNDEVRYEGSATRQDAEALGAALKESQYFQGRGVSVILSKGSDGTVIAFVVKDGLWDDPKNIEGFTTLGRALAPSVGGLPIHVHLVNQAIETKKEIPIAE